MPIPPLDPSLDKENNVRFATRMVSGANTGAAWVAAVDLLSGAPERKLLHLRTHITHPGTEDQQIRAIVADILARCGKPSIETVVNTAFPAALAARTSGPAELVARYRAMYPTIRSLSPINRRGTYFGRLVEYPARDGTVDQLTRLVDQLTRDRGRSNRPRAIYESTTDAPHVEVDSERVGYTEAHVDQRPDAESEPLVVGVPIYAPTPDTVPMSFPCLSHLSFQRDGHRLHLLALYRSQYLIERGYGNYLALGLLQRYVAEHSGLEIGELTIDAGLASFDGSPRVVARCMEQLSQCALL